MKKQETEQGQKEILRELERLISSKEPILSSKAESDLVKLMEEKEETFSEKLLQFIDQSGRSDADVYRQASLNRKLFSKIRSRRDYQPGKMTALALALSLRLSEKDTAALLRAAGYALSRSQDFDIIVTYFLRRRTFDFAAINAALRHFGQKTFGG